MNNPDTKINERNLSNVVNTVISATVETSIICDMGNIIN